MVWLCSDTLIPAWNLFPVRVSIFQQNWRCQIKKYTGKGPLCESGSKSGCPFHVDQMARMQEIVPVVCVLTIVGIGLEMNGGGYKVLSRDEVLKILKDSL